MLRVAFNRASDPVEHAIALFSAGKWNHVELVFSDGAAFSSDARDGNVRITYEIDFDQPNWDMVAVPGTAAHESLVRRWCERECNKLKGFNFMGLLRFLLPMLPKQGDRSMFCTQAVTLALQQIGLLDGIDPENVRPGDLYAMVRSLAFVAS